MLLRYIYNWSLLNHQEIWVNMIIKQTGPGFWFQNMTLPLASFWAWEKHLAVRKKNKKIKIVSLQHCLGNTSFNMRRVNILVANFLISFSSYRQQLTGFITNIMVQWIYNQWSNWVWWKFWSIEACLCKFRQANYLIRIWELNHATSFLEIYN